MYHNHRPTHSTVRKRYQNIDKDTLKNKKYAIRVTLPFKIFITKSGPNNGIKLSPKSGQQPQPPLSNSYTMVWAHERGDNP